MNNVVIYCIKNILTEKVYIGSAIDYKSRWRNHKNQLKNNFHHNIKLQNSWNLYGDNFFVFEILEYVEDKNILIEREQYYLNTILFASENDDRFDKLGYNILREAGNSMGYKHSAETILKLKGENNPMFGKSVWIGRNHTEESKELISLSKKGKLIKSDNHFYNKNHTDESKVKMSFSSKRLSGSDNPNFGKESKNRKIVIQLDKSGKIIKEWPHAGEASKALGINSQNIGACCLGKQKTYKGFIWQYKIEKVKSESEIQLEIISLYNETNITQREICKLYKMSPNKLSKLLKTT